MHAAIDDLLDQAKAVKAARDNAARELAALIRALEGLEGVGRLDATQARELKKLTAKAPGVRAKRRRKAPAAR